MDNWLRNVTVVRIAALILGILLWAVVHLDQQNTSVPSAPAQQTRTISDVQITTVGLNTEQYQILSMEPSQVHIVLRGRASAVNQVNTVDGENQIQLDLSEITEGEHLLPLKSVGFPAGVAVDIYPPNVNVKVEAIQSKEVPVIIELRGEPAEGFKAGVPIHNPNRVNVRVSSSRLDQVVSARAIVDITGAQAAVEVDETLVAIDQNGNEVQSLITPAVVNVEVPITSPFRTIPLQINLINEPPDGYSVSSFTQSINEVTVYGSEEALSELDIYDGLEIDLSRLTNSRSYTLPIPLMGDITQVLPARVDVQIGIVPSTVETIEQLPIQLSGENEEYDTQIISTESSTIDLIVEGAPSVLADIQPGDIQAIVDVSNLPPGIYNQTVKLNLPTFVKYGGDEEITVRVEIKLKTDEASSGDAAEEGNDGEQVNNETNDSNTEPNTLG